MGLCPHSSQGVDIHDTFCWGGPCRCPKSSQSPETMLVSDSHAVTVSILIWVTCAATGAMVTSGSKLLQRAMSESMVLVQLISCEEKKPVGLAGPTKSWRFHKHSISIRNNNFP